MVTGQVNVSTAVIVLKVLHTIGASVISHSDCPQCGTCSLTDYTHRQHLCGYCGYGPWHVAKNGNIYGPPLDGQTKPYRRTQC